MHTANAFFPAFTFPKLPQLRHNLTRIFALILACVMINVTVGCSAVDAKTAAQEIANTLPQLDPYIVTAQGIIDALDPAAAPIVDAGVTAIIAGKALIQTALSNYAASPSATAWGAVVDAITKTLNDNAATILTLSHVTNPDSRAKALVVIGAIQTSLLLLLSIVQNVKDKATSAKLKAAAQATPIKLSQYKQYLDKNMVETATGHSFDFGVAYETAQGF